MGSLLGEWLGINQLLGKLWFWFGHQGWEYLELGRAWQILLAAGLLFWLVLLFRGIAPARRDPESREVASLFLYAAIAIPLFYLPAMFFGPRGHFSVVDTWRFWIIHLWVEGFFELFVTVMVAVIFYKLGMVSHLTATRVVYLDADSVPGERHHRDGAPLVLDGTIAHHHGAGRPVLRLGGRSADAPHAGRVGLHPRESRDL